MEDKKLTKMRYAKVFESAKDDYVIKLILSGLVWLWAGFQNVFSTHGELIILLGAAIIIDWITGHIKARKQGIEIMSFGWRQTVVKVLEYAAFLIILTGISNVFGEPDVDNWVGETLRVVSNIDWFGYLYLTMTELKSISENLSGEKGSFDRLMKIIKKKIGLDNIE